MKGSCMCGAVRFDVQPPLKLFQYCHCSRCRKTSGSVHSANLFVAPEQLQWLQGEDMLTRFEPPAAKYYATTFCKRCGSSLPWLVQGGRSLVIPAGSLDEEPELLPQQNIFCGSRPQWSRPYSDLPENDTLPPKS